MSISVQIVTNDINFCLNTHVNKAYTAQMKNTSLDSFLKIMYFILK